MNDEQNPPNERALFLAALEQPNDAERAAYLDAACGSDAKLRAVVDALLKNHSDDSFMGVAAAEQVETLEDERTPAEAVGTTMGRYKLLEKLGEGGFGTVWAAEQREPVRRRVALKIIKLGMDTKQVVARFEAERQALALMDHPNIAKVLDAGTTSAGRPYFVMELVKGIAITKFCEQEALSHGDRLNLFIKVCQALQHAHQKGVIHRDIKPSNILVTLHDGVPVPKVIDFGIAKATHQELTEKTIYTQFQQFIGTPAYMSPEQAEMSGLDIDTRSDIYSLGVLLYELLTGTTPFDAEELMRSGIDEMRKIIRERDPQRPSTKVSQTSDSSNPSVRRGISLNASIDQDLDWIVMKCLEKDRARRYETANGLAADLKRYLHDQPVIARPPSRMYQLQKAWRRNRVVYSSGAAVVVALLFGLALAADGWRRAGLERDDAVEARAETELQRQAALARKAEADEERLVAIRAKEDVRRRAYASEMNIAFQAFKESNLFRARQLLERQVSGPGEADLRGFEWRYLSALAGGDELATFPEQSGGPVTVFSPDDRLVVFAGEKDTCVYDISSRVRVAKLSGYPNTAAFSPQAPILATAWGWVRLWDTRTWQLLRTLPNARGPVVYSPDGKWLVTGTKSGYSVWDTETWTETPLCRSTSGSGFQIRHAVAFSPDGSFLCTPGEGPEAEIAPLQLWRFPSLEKVAQLDALEGGMGCVAFLPDGDRLVVGQADGKLRVCDIRGNELFARNEHTAWITAVAVSANGETVATTSSDRTLCLWDASTLELKARLRGHVGEVWSLDISADGRMVVSGSVDGMTKLWEATSHAVPSVVKGLLLNFTDDGRTLILGSSEEMTQWDVTRGAAKSEWPSSTFGDAAIRNYSQIAVLPSQALMAIGAERAVELWHLNEMTQFAEFGVDEGGIASVALSADGERLIAGTTLGNLRVWDLTSREVIADLEVGESGIDKVTLSANAMYAAAVSGRRVVAWKIAEKRAAFEFKAKALITSVEFSPDGSLLATSELQSNRVTLHRVPSGELVDILLGHVQGVGGASFSPDGKTLATGSHDRKVKLWNLATGQEVATLDVEAGVAAVRFSPDGRTLGASYYTDRGIFTRVWRAPGFEDVER